MIPFRFEASSPSPADECRIVVPAGIESKVALLRFLAGAIPLPDYFGHNWDALEECLGDLAWLGPGKIALIHQDIPLEKADADRRIYLQILSRAATASGRLSVIFPESCRREIIQALAVAG